jgi:hypothetical protein
MLVGEHGIPLAGQEATEDVPMIAIHVASGAVFVTVPLTKRDRPRAIDRVIDYFGEAGQRGAARGRAAIARALRGRPGRRAS